MSAARRVHKSAFIRRSDPLCGAALFAASAVAHAGDMIPTAESSGMHGAVWTIVAVVIVFGAVVAVTRRLGASAAKPDLTAMPELNGLDASAFKQVVAEAYRGRGYEVREAGDAATEADLVLTKGNQQSLVLCRHWQRGRVGMRQVRALYGAMAAHSAQSGVVITAGSFVADAFRFAGLGHIELIDHGKLAAFLHAKPTSDAGSGVRTSQLQTGTA